MLGMVCTEPVFLETPRHGSPVIAGWLIYLLGSKMEHTVEVIDG